MDERLSPARPPQNRAARNGRSLLPAIQCLFSRQRQNGLRELECAGRARVRQQLQAAAEGVRLCEVAEEHRRQQTSQVQVLRQPGVYSMAEADPAVEWTDEQQLRAAIGEEQLRTELSELEWSHKASLSANAVFCC